MVMYKLPAMPHNPYPGFNTKRIGRVSNMALGKIAGVNCPIEHAHMQDREQREQEGVEKTAEFLNPAFKNGIYSTLGAAAAGVTLYGAGKAVDAAANLWNASKYDNALKDAIKLSPTLQLHGYEALRPYMPIIVKSSPTVAGEPRLLANYLESMIDAEGHLNMATFAELTRLENNILNNRDMRNNLQNTIISGSLKGFTEGAGKGMSQAILKSNA